MAYEKNLIPHFIDEQYRAGNFRGELHAYTMFIDLSGFTALTETLMKHGSEGAEALSRILNDLFAPMVHHVYQRGGFVTYYAGDSFIAVFPDSLPGEDVLAFLATAIQLREIFTGRELQETRFGTFKMGIRMGLSFGNVEWGIVGKQQHSFYFKGDAIDQCAENQNYAGAKEILFDQQLSRLLPANSTSYTLLTESHRESQKSAYVPDGMFSLENLETGSTHIPHPKALQPITHQVLSHFFPQTILELDNTGEFRPVVSVFISIKGNLDHPALDALTSTVLDHVNNYAGYFKEVDFSDKGGVLVCFFGAPVAYENYQGRALEFALALKEALTDLQGKFDIDFRMGITTGIAYCGIVGGIERCQYAIVGYCVNLASRFMLHADWGEILTDRDIQKIHSFAFTHKGDIAYKGISTDIATYVLTGRNADSRPSFLGDMIGRAEELNILFQIATKTFSGQSYYMALVFGEPGIGKSRLSFELKQLLATKGPLTWIPCHTDQILRKSFNPFVYGLKNYFRQSPENTHRENRAMFEKIYRQTLEEIAASEHPQQVLFVPELERTKSIIAAYLGIVLPDSLWERLDAKGRYENTLLAIQSFFMGVSLIRPLVIELEDIHWLDEQSITLLQDFLRRAPRYPIFLLMTSRYQDDGSKAYIFEEKNLRQNGIKLHEADLNILSPPSIREFSEKRLNGAIHEDLFELLVRTTNGNPFYVEQILAYFTESSLLEWKNDQWHLRDKNIKLSNSIHAILTARIDRLSRLVKETVKTAAVIGREFDLPILTEVMRQQDDFAKFNGNMSNVLKEQIQTAERWQIWRAMNELRYIFRHSLLREAIYDMQIKTRLRELHLHIAQAIEKLYKGTLDDRFVDLAFHYEQAGEVAKTKEFLLKAADIARQNYQNQQALDFYDKLLLLIGVNGEPSEIVSILLRKGSILELIGKWDAGLETYHEALNKAVHLNNLLPVGKAYNAIGQVMLLKGNYEEALTFLEQALRAFENCHDSSGLFATYANLGNLYFRQGQYDIAQEYFSKSLHYGKSLTQTATHAQIAANLGLTYMNLGNYKAGINTLLDQLNRTEAQQDRQGMANILTNLGIIYFEKGDYDQALECYEKGLAFSEELGNKMLTSIAIGCIGTVYERKGDFDKAMELYVRDLALCEELGDKQGIAISLGLLGGLHTVMGDFDQAMSYLKKARKYCKKLYYQKGIAKAHKDLAAVYLFQKKYDKALGQYSKAIDICRRINNKLVLGQCLVEKGRTLIMADRFEEATPVHLEAIELAEQLGNPELIFQSILLEAVINFHAGLRDIGDNILNDLIRQYPSDRNQADIYYEWAELYPADASYRQKAYSLYEKLYREVPKYLYKVRMEELA